MTKVEAADRMHRSKYNCCQSVICAFSEELGVAPEVLFKIGEGFGLGAGCMEGICGALSGAIMAAGLVNSDGNLGDPGTKGTTYKISREMMNRFTEKTGGLICKDLKGVETGKPLCSCPDCIKAGVEVVSEVLGLPAE